MIKEISLESKATAKQCLVNIVLIGKASLCFNDLIVA